MEHNISALKLIKTEDEENKFKVAAAFVNGQITLYDLSLNELKTVVFSASEYVI